MIEIVQMMSQRGSPSVGLMTRRLVAQDDEAMVFTKRGDVKGLQNLISEKKLDLRWVITDLGRTPLSVSLCWVLRILKTLIDNLFRLHLHIIL